MAEYAEFTRTDHPWPGNELNYLDNIANQKALEFYQRHGVKRVNTAGLKAKDTPDCVLMTCKYCIRAQLSMCPKMTAGQNSAIVEPLILVDCTGEYQLGFDCEKCEMTVRKHNKGKA